MKFKIGFTFLILCFLLAASLLVGTVNLFAMDTELAWNIFYSIRLPRSLAIVFVGASLGISGFILQSILHNPLAEPFTLGISGGASVGVSIAVLFGIYPLWLSLPLLSGLTCVALTVVIFKLAQSFGGWNQKNLILAGIILSYFCSSLSYISISALSPTDLGSAIKWLMGRFGEERDSWWPFMAGLFALSYLVLHFKSKSLEYYHLGEDLALSFTKKNKDRILAVALVSLLAAATVVIAGVVAFVGLMAPHISTLIFKSVRYKYILPLSAMIGAILLLSSDILSRLLFPLSDIPAGGIITILGTPFLFYLLLKRPDDSFKKL